MSKYLITQKQYEAVMGSNPSYFTYDKSCPVDCVTWHDAVAFCKKLSKITGQKVKLPSEAQWEYTCRAGSTGKYCFGDDVSELEKYAWFGNNSGDAPLNTDHIWETNQNNYFDCLSENDCGTNKVGEKLSNTWGLYDMHGNVLEWCEDVWHENYNNAPIRGNVWRKGGDQNKRILRGGSCYRRDCDCSSAKRDSEFANGKFSDIGFRVVIL
jgi:formylglycine-generating enzyme required for sulfatase activity